MSELVLAADPRSSYSHVGLVLMRAGTALVVNAEPGDGDTPGGTIAEPWAKFTADDEVGGYAVYRVRPGLEPLAHEAARRAMAYAQADTPFDAAFDLASEDKLYCTELVWRSYLAAGIDLSDGRRDRLGLPLLQKDVLLPSTILHSKDLMRVAAFNATEGVQE